VDLLNNYLDKIQTKKENINEGFGLIVIAVIVALLTIAGFKEYRDEKKARQLALKLAPIVAKKLEDKLQNLIPPLMSLGKQILSIITSENEIPIKALRLGEDKEKLLNKESYRKAIKSYIFENIKSYIRHKGTAVLKYTQGIFLSYDLETYIHLVTAGDDLSENLVAEMEKRSLKYEDDSDDGGSNPSPLYMKYWKDCMRIIEKVQAIDKKSKNVLKAITIEIIGITTTLVKQYKG
jgi:hypothetical protein